MKSFKREYIVILMFVLLVSSSDALGRKRVTMRISNEVETTNPLNLHCKSGDNDFGGKVLKYKQYFEFSFKPNIFGKTVFRCDFVLNDYVYMNKLESLNQTNIDVYGGRSDGLKCRACFWAFREKGLCLGPNSTGPFYDCRVIWYY
ncbi:S-protein homolog 29-like [Mercurialis annua]|uniref:S-protein homolog 29-like n=1 Tax=Mercurialis annua TaxID=3986 RepID=UPI0024AD2D86|nr:S-protein homolog 29-like [Mercurialis annua]